MRLSLAALFVLAGASAASAQVVQDRYGPPRKRAEPVALAALGESAYGGPLLGWAGKAAPRAETPAPAPQPIAPQAYAPAPRAAPAAAPVMPTPRYAPRQSAIQTPAPYAPPPATNRPAQAAMVQPAAAQPAFAPRPAPALAAAQAPAPAPRPRPVLAGGPPQSEPAPAAMSPRPAAAPRYYSLHREYGRAPDAIPPQATGPRYVLIGPPDAPSAPGDQDGDESPKSSGQF